jgi:hypothetical protein
METEMQIDGFQGAEGALGAGQVLVGSADALGRQGFVLDAGADDAKPIEAGVSGDAGGVAGEAEADFGGVNVGQLGGLIAVLRAADGARDLVSSFGAVPQAIWSANLANAWSTSVRLEVAARKRAPSQSSAR